jgi:hypothetical protein
MGEDIETDENGMERKGELLPRVSTRDLEEEDTNGFGRLKVVTVGEPNGS